MESSSSSLDPLALTHYKAGDYMEDQDIDNMSEISYTDQGDKTAKDCCEIQTNFKDKGKSIDYSGQESTCKPNFDINIDADGCNFNPQLGTNRKNENVKTSLPKNQMVEVDHHSWI